MKQLIKFLSLLISVGIFGVSGAAQDDFRVENLETSYDTVEVVRGGICANCGSASMHRYFFCGTYEDYPATISAPCTNHDSCTKVAVYAVRFYEDRCNSCGAIRATGRVSDDSHLEFFVHSSNGQIDSVCTLIGHMN